jgi:hypothetical protein
LRGVSGDILAGSNSSSVPSKLTPPYKSFLQLVGPQPQ